MMESPENSPDQGCLGMGFSPAQSHVEGYQAHKTDRPQSGEENFIGQGGGAEKRGEQGKGQDAEHRNLTIGKHWPVEASGRMCGKESMTDNLRMLKY